MQYHSSKIKGHHQRLRVFFYIKDLVPKILNRTSNCFRKSKEYEEPYGSYTEPRRRRCQHVGKQYRNRTNVFPILSKMSIRDNLELDKNCFTILNSKRLLPLLGSVLQEDPPKRRMKRHKNQNQPEKLLKKGGSTKTPPLHCQIKDVSPADTAGVTVWKLLVTVLPYLTGPLWSLYLKVVSI